MAVLTAPVTTYAPARSGWRDLDWLLLLVVLGLSIWGCVTQVSASLSPDGAYFSHTAALGATRHAVAAAGRLPGSHGGLHGAGPSDAVKQAVWIGLGIGLMLLLAFADYQLLMHLQFPVYIFNLCLLGSVLVLGHKVNGARSWLMLGPFALEPAEFCKFAVILTLAAFVCRRQERIGDFSTLMWSLLYVLVPVAFILKEPDFGTSIAILSIWLGVMFFGGARLWHIGLVLLIGISLFGVAWKTGRLKEHQKERLAVFLDSNYASQSSGYQVKESQIAIGSGQLTGEGFGQGIQTHGGFMPENRTDFVFTIVAEELGFIGAATVIVGFFILLLRSAMLAMSTENYFGALIAGGFTFLVGYHAIVNIGMTMRVMPCTGVPLPFFSYGGSSYLAFSLCAGLLQSIAMRRKRATTF